MCHWQGQFTALINFKGQKPRAQSSPENLRKSDTEPEEEVCSEQQHSSDQQMHDGVCISTLAQAQSRSGR